MLTVWHCQYYQPMVINSLAVSFMVLALLSLQKQPIFSVKSTRNKNIWSNSFSIFTRIIFTLLGTVTLNIILKKILGQTDDNHIFQFVASWIGYQDDTDFDTRLYQCLAVFRPLGKEMYINLMANAALPLYFIYMILQWTGLSLTLLRKWYIKEKEEKENNSEEKLDLLHRFYEMTDFQFMFKMDQYPAKVYHAGKSCVHLKTS